MSLTAQRGEYVFDPKKLHPTTISQIESTSEKVWNTGLKDRNNMGLFMESIGYVGELCRGNDSTLVDYCLAIEGLINRSTLSQVESALSRNLSFLKEHSLHTSHIHTLIIEGDSIHINAQDLSYTINNARITHSTPKGSLHIDSVNGLYYPIQDSMYIKSARLSYPLSLTDSIVYHISAAKLNPSVPLLSSNYTSVDVPRYYIKNISGRIEYLLPNGKSPIFHSHESLINIHDSTLSFTASGRLHIQGNDIYMDSTSSNHARFTASKADEPIASIRSHSIHISDSSIRMPRSSVTINIANDSITHPLLLSIYDRKENTLTLYQSEDKLSSAPFYNSFSGLKMYARAVRIDCNDKDIAFAFDSRVRPLVISSRYFEGEIYRHFRGVGKYNPLDDILSACGVARATSIKEVARATASSLTTATLLAMEISRLGYGYYDYLHHTLTLYPGFEHMVRSAHGKSDYDGIAYYGIKDRDIIARMDGETGNIDLSGMEMVKLSIDGNIYLSPDSTGVIAQKGGNFSYGGSITLGLFTIDGHAEYEYDKNSITLSGTSQMKMHVPIHSGKHEQIKNTIDSLCGEITLGYADDKSMKRSHKRYPMLSTTTQSYIFYPHLDSLYGREHLFLTIEPFILDSLSSRSTSSIYFDGTLHTGGIVPPFERRVSVMKDLTLGFEKADLSIGVPLYSRGTYYGTLDLDSKGLTGEGRYTYMSTTISSPSLRMYPYGIDSPLSSVEIENSIEYDTPQASIDDVATHWDTESDTITIYADSSLCHIYDYNFTGTMYLSPHSLTGDGHFMMKNSRIDSPRLEFHRDSIFSRDANLAIGIDSSHMVSINNAQFLYSLPYNTGYFSTNASYPAHIKSLNTHINICQGEWSDGSPIINFYSKNKRGSVILDGECMLTIPCQSAVYDMGGDSLRVEGIDSLTFTDAYIIPSSSHIAILTGGDIAPLDDAIIILDTSSMYHRLYDAHIEILPSCEIKGSATYDYTDPDGITYPMHFTDISTDASGHLLAAADTYMERDYELGAYFRFRGQSTLKGNVKGLGLRGRLYPIENICPSMITGCIKIDAPVGDTLCFTPTEDKPTNGIIYSHTGFTGVFMGNDISSHSLLCDVQGIISHDDYTGTYIVGDSSSYPLYHYFHDECRLSTRGDIFINDPSGFMKSTMAGEIEYDMNNGNITGENISLSLHMEFPSLINENLLSLASQMAHPSISESSSSSWDYISQKSDITSSTIALEGISLRGDSSSGVLSYSGTASLRFLCASPTMLILHSKISITKSASGTDEITIYLHSENDRQYIFLRYKNGVMDFMCSDNDTMKAFDTATEKYRDTSSGEYLIRRASKSRVEDFKSTFK